MTKEELLEAAKSLPAEDISWLAGKLLVVGFTKAINQAVEDI